MFVIDNNVRTTLTSAVGVSDTSINVATASTPWNTPPDPNGDDGVIVLVNWTSTPVKIEIVHYTGATYDTDHWVLSGCTRGAESSSAQAWTTGEGAEVIGGLTIAQLAHLWDKTRVQMQELVFTSGATSRTFSHNLPAAPDGVFLNIQDAYYGYAHTFTTSEFSVTLNSSPPGDVDIQAWLVINE